MKYIKKISLLSLIITPLAVYAMNQESQDSNGTENSATSIVAHLSSMQDSNIQAISASSNDFEVNEVGHTVDCSVKNESAISGQNGINPFDFGCHNSCEEEKNRDQVNDCFDSCSDSSDDNLGHSPTNKIPKYLINRWLTWLSNPKKSFKFYQEMQEEINRIKKHCNDQTQTINCLSDRCQLQEKLLENLEENCQARGREIEYLRGKELSSLLETDPGQVFKTATEHLKNKAEKNHFAVKTTTTVLGAPLGSDNPYVVKAIEQLGEAYDPADIHALNLRPLEQHIRNNQSVLSFTKKDAARTAMVTLPCVAITVWLMNWVAKRS